MTLFFTAKKRARKTACSGLTVTEMLVSVSLLAVIIIGLYAMFDMTQRAFMTGLRQVDIMESGRAAMDLIVRDLEQTSPSGVALGTNFYAASIPVNLNQKQEVLPNLYRTNILQEFFFLTRFQDRLRGIGYKVARLDTNQSANVLFQNGVGALYRFDREIRYRDFSTNWPNTNNLVLAFKNAGTNQLERVTDNVIHIQLKVFDTNGWEMTFRTNLSPSTVRLSRDFVEGQTQFAFMSNALPAAVEVELGILDPLIVEHARSIPNDKASRDYVLKQGNKVHLLRQRVPIRNFSK